MVDDLHNLAFALMTCAPTRACEKLYNRATRPRILRIFVRMDGSFRVRLLSNERRQRGRHI